MAQAAACIGREFAYLLLAAVSPCPRPELRDALGRLVAAELVFRRGEPPEASYTFKHALVRDAAYESLLREVGADSYTPASPGPWRRASPRSSRPSPKSWPGITRPRSSRPRRCHTGCERASKRSSARP